MMRFVLITVGLTLGLCGCAGFTEPLGMEDPFAIAQPFRGLERNDEMIAQAIEVPALVVDVPQGMATEVATVLRDQVVEAARKHDIPALSVVTPRAWVLNAQAATIAASDKAGGEQTVISWRLFDATGRERTQFPVTFAGTDASLSVGGVQLLAEQTATALETALTHPGRQVATNAAATVRPIAWIRSVKVRRGRQRRWRGAGVCCRSRASRSI
jgi:hypothetical protein